MKQKTLHIDFNDSTLGTIAREGEHNRTQLVFVLDEDLQACDFINVEFGIESSGEKLVLENLCPEEGDNTLKVSLTQDVTVSGVLTIQLVGYVIDSATSEPQIIVKSPVVSGVITPSIKGVKKIAQGTAELLDRILAKVHVLIEKMHSHTNASTLDKFGENISGGLLFGGKDIGGVKSLTAFPETAAEGDVVLLHRCNNITADDSNSGVLLDITAIVALGLPEGYEQRVWEIAATSPKGRDFYAIIEISRIDDYILTALNLATATIGGRWYWKNGELTTDIVGGEAELPPVYIPLGNVADFTFTKTLFDIDYEETPDMDETVIFRTLPVHYMFLKGEWQLVSPNNEALQRAVEELQRNVGKYIPMTRVETTTTGTSILEPNKMYNYGVVDTLTLDFAEGTPDKVNEYLISFVSGETATVLTLPSSVKWVNELTVEANKRYEISVVDNVALWCAVDYEVTE